MPTIPEALAVAVRYHQAGHLQQAEAIYRQIVQVEPDNAESWRNLGALCMGSSRFDEAAGYYQQALRLQPGHAPTHNDLGIVLAQQGKIQDAIASFQHALRLQPGHVEAQKNLTILLKQHQQGSAAAPGVSQAQVDAVKCNRRAMAFFQQGRLNEAVLSFQQAVHIFPEFAEAHANLGNVLYYQGKHDEAIACYYQAMRLKPDYAEAYNNLGTVLKDQGQLAAAAIQYQEALRLKPDYAEAHYNLGAVLKDQGQLAAAVIQYQEALRLKPNYAEAHNNLGTALKEQGQLADAEAQYQQAVRLKPDFAEAHNNLGNTLKDQGQFVAAVSQYQEALRLKPDFAEAHLNLGNALRDQGQLAAALAQYQEALRVKPEGAEVHLNLGNALRDRGQLAAALAQYQEALRLKPEYAEAHNNLGIALRKQGQLAEAVAQHQEALRLKPDFAEAHNNLGNVLTDLGQLAAALAHYQEAPRLKPNLGSAYYNLSRLVASGYYRFSKDDIHALKKLLEDGQQPILDLSCLHLTLADCMDKIGNYDDAFEHYRQGNELRQEYLQQRGQAFNPSKAVDLVGEIIATFNRDYFTRVRLFGLDTELPVFIVGMPRSGTTLVEQILCSHPRIFGAGELPDIPRMVEDLPVLLNTPEKYPACVTRIDRQTVQTMAQRHLQRISQLGGDVLRVIDKLPANHQHLGFIHTMYPRARIIHCCRDPLDTCVSCYCLQFEHLHFATTLEGIAVTYRLYEQMMAHWREVLPGQFFEVRYEELVENQAAVSRALIAFCGMEWDDRCLAFHETQRAIQTASSVQVRQPIYHSSVGRWKRYEPHLKPLIEALQKFAGMQDYHT